MDLARMAQAIAPHTLPSPVKGFEHVRGYGVFALPFDSGHVLTLRVFPQNDFAPYVTVWHRTPEGAWSIFVDGPRIDTACPRYYGAAAERSIPANITVTWPGPMTLSVEMDAPRLTWTATMTETPLVRAMNALSSALPERLWRTPAMLRTFERVGGKLFDLGTVDLSGRVPNGQMGVLMPRRMFPVGTSSARLDGVDLGEPSRARDNPSIGALRLPARGIFAVGGGYFEIQDPAAYESIRRELASGRNDA